MMEQLPGKMAKQIRDKRREPLNITTRLKGAQLRNL